MSHLYAFIMAGGRGERFWPLSVYSRPKQFVSLFGGRPLIAHAADRLETVVPRENIYVITSQDLVPATQAALPDIPKANIIGEPMGRDTAAAVALACGITLKRDPNGVAAILTADHLMADVSAFRRVLTDTYSVAASRPVIATIGIAPTFPATGYGYIECADTLTTDADIGTPFRRVRRFVEKPDRATAEAYLATGAFVWNAGMFIWQAGIMREAFEKYAPAWLPVIKYPDAIRTLYPTLPKLSVDYAIMEKSDSLVVARGDFGWDDVGSLPAIAEHFPTDADGNTAISPAITLNSTSCIIAAEGDQRTTALLGVSDLIVVHTSKATLVCAKSAAQDIKKLVAKLPPDLK